MYNFVLENQNTGNDNLSPIAHLLSYEFYNNSMFRYNDERPHSKTLKSNESQNRKQKKKIVDGYQNSRYSKTRNQNLRHYTVINWFHYFNTEYDKH